MGRSSSGASLIETIVSLAIVGIAAMAFAQLSSNFGDVRKFMQASVSYRDLTSDLEDTLSTADRCFEALKGEIIDPTIPGIAKQVTLKVPRDSGNVGDMIPYTPGTYYKNDPASGLRISKVELLNASTPENSPTGSPAARVLVNVDGAQIPAMRYYMNLTVFVERENSKPRTAQFGGSFRPRVFGLSVTVDPATNEILRCGSDANLEQACTEASGNYIPGPPPQCDIAPAFGGCLFGGTFGLEEKICEWENPIQMQDATVPLNKKCSCPAGYTANKVIDFDAGKAKARDLIELWNCYKCT